MVSRRARARLLAGGILAAGWTVALVVYVTAAPPAADDPEIFDLEHSKAYARQVEVIGGKAAAFGSDLNAWVASLWHGRPLAYTIAVLTAAVALVAWWLASTEYVPPGAGREG